MTRTEGITLLELLLVLALLGIVVSLGFFNGRRALAVQQETAAINSIRQSVWQGATAAAASGRKTELVRDGRRLVVHEPERNRVIRTEELPSGVATNLPSGTVLVFTPPGRVASLDAIPDPLWVQAGDRRYHLELSVIGEVRAVETR